MSVYDRVDISLDIDLESVAAVEDQTIRRVLTAASRAVQRVTRRLEKNLEATTRAAVPGRLWRAWTSEVAPKAGRIAREPAGWVRLNSRRWKDGRMTRTYGAMEYWSSPGAIRGTHGNYLAIPTRAAGSQGRARDLTPGEWERQTGKKLRLIKSEDRGGSGKAGLLVADMATTSKRTGVYRPITRQRTAADQRRGYVRGEQSVPIFVLVQSVPFADAFSTEDDLRQAEAELVSEFEALLG